MAGIAEPGVTSRIIYFGRAAGFSKADGKPSTTEDAEVHGGDAAYNRHQLFLWGIFPLARIE
jgi:hypothetical protein